MIRLELMLRILSSISIPTLCFTSNKLEWKFVLYQIIKYAVSLV